MNPKVALEECIKNALDAMSLPLDENFFGTPRRVASYLMEFNTGVSLEGLRMILGTPFTNDGIDELIAQTNIPFRAMCAHHLLPFFGTVSIGYIPDKKIVGLSKLARLVDAAGTRRPSLQETITNDIARVLEETLEPLGLIVAIHAEHTCMAIRGIAAIGVTTSTSAVKGLLKTNSDARQEFFELVAIHGHRR